MVLGVEPVAVEISPDAGVELVFESSKPDTFLGVSVAQPGLDLTIELQDPAGRRLERSNLVPAGAGAEELNHVLEVAGTYRLLVTLEPKDSEAGSHEATVADPPQVYTTEVVVTEQRPATASDPRRIAAWKHYTQGRGLQRRNDGLENAINHYRQALIGWRELGEPLWVASTLDNLGTCQRRSGDLSGALVSYEAAIGSWVEANYSVGQVQTHLNLGLTFRQLGHLESAESAYRNALALAARGVIPDTLHGQIHNNLGVLLDLRGESQAAELELEQAVELRRRVGRPVDLARSLNNLGSVQTGLARFTSARETLAEARDLARTAASPDVEAAAVANLGLIHAWEGELALALSSYRRAQELHHATGSLVGEAEVLRNLGTLYLDFGERREALRMYKRQHTLLLEAGREAEAAGALVNIGWIASLDGDHLQALDFYQRALTRLMIDGRPATRSFLLEKIGYSKAELGDRAGARQSYKTALALARKHGLGMREIKTLVGLATLHEVMGEHPKALRTFEQAVTLAERFGSRLELAGALMGAARNSGDWRVARQQVRRALELVESVRDSSLGPHFRSALLAQRLSYYRFGIDLLLRRHAIVPDPALLEDVFALVERSHARELLEKLHGRWPLNGRGAEPARAREAKQILRELEALEGIQRRFDPRWSERMTPGSADGEMTGYPTPETVDSTSRQALERARIRRREELVREYRELQVLDRLGQARTASVVPSTLRDLQAREIDPDVVVLVFLLGDTTSSLLVITRDEVTSLPLAGRTDLLAKLHDFGAALTFPGERPRISSLAERQEWAVEEWRAEERLRRLAIDLGERLLGPASRFLEDGKTLAIVTRNELSKVPLAALGIPGEATYTPLAVRHQIVRIPSLSAVAQLRRRTRSAPLAPAGVVLFGDPLMPADPRVDRSGVEEAGIPSAWDYPQLARVSRLPSSLREVERISALARPLGEVRLLSGKEAAKSRILSPDIERYRFLHFATHGLVDDRIPELSSLMLSFFDDHGRPIEGLLRVHEVETLRLRAELVTLSACQTGVGRDLPGEGLLSLARSFLIAGSQQVVATLWQVNDAATETFMETFYRRLFEEHLPVARALQQAQVEMMEQPRWSHPYYWAPFVLHGDWRPPGAGNTAGDPEASHQEP